MSAADLMDFSPEVAEARAERKPIVALESTIITHGMPYPRNVETARMVEDAVRAFGRDAGDDRRHRRALPGRPRAQGDRKPRRAFGRRGQGVAARPRPGRRPARLGRHDGRRDDVPRRARRHRDLRHRRHRRRPSRSRGDLRHLRRSGRAVAHPRRRRLRRGEVDPRHREDARVPGDAGGGDRRLPLRRISRLLRPLVRLQARAPLRRPARPRPHDPPAARHRPRRPADRQSGPRGLRRSRRR